MITLAKPALSRSNPRRLALEALHRWRTHHSLLADVLREDILRAHPLHDPRDQRLFTELFYGVLRSLSLLDFWIGNLREGKVDHKTRDLLRLGLYQIMRLRVPEHAAVSETVALAGPAKSLVNAVLRRALREKDALEVAAAETSQAIRESHPEFLLDRWKKQFGPEITQELCEWNNEPAPMYVRLNRLHDDLLKVMEQPGLDPVPNEPEFLLATQAIDPPWLENGVVYAQDPATAAVCRLLKPQPGETVLDACAAPGGKAAFLAEMMENRGKIAACDSSGPRCKMLEQNLYRLGVKNAQVFKLDWLRADGPFPEEFFDAILVDVPCSNTGVMRRRVDARWRLRPEDFQKMPEIQRGIVKKVLPLLKRGGRLVYSTCSLEAEENREVVEGIIDSSPGALMLENEVFKNPWSSGTDGAYGALIRKTE